MSAPVGIPDAPWPGELIDRLRRVRPRRDAPAKHHLVWHDEMAPLWDQIAATDPVLADNALRLAAFHRGEAARLAELDPDLPDDAGW